ncbi:hypothetical protein SSX86_007737 [Deinandra increscens subsp. villosa]|uniref:Cytochrome P450 n=1 Tax=Deinandra increscens subsp. villosa TaxID=3103831 RepID=A0AAP0DI28_9ASTR
MDTLYLCILLLVLAWSIFNKYLITKIKNLPPTPLSALTVIGFRTIFKQPIHQTLSYIANRHGPILLLRFGCRLVLLISSESAAEDLFTNNDVVFAHRPKLIPAKVFGCNYTNLAWVPHGAHWRHLRRVSCLEILPFHRKPDQQDLLGDEVKELLRRLYCNNKVLVNLKPMFLDLVFNVMMRIFAGKSVLDRYCQKKTTEEGETNEPISLLEYATRSFKMTTGETDLIYFMPILKLLGVTDLEQRCTQMQRKGDSLLNNLLEEIREKSNDGLCQKEEKVIQILLEKQREDPKHYSDEIIKGLVQVSLSAGTDSSAGTLEWAFSLLLNHPEVLQKAQNEIDNYVGKDRFLKQSDIDHLPYLRCIVKEAMRLYPVAPLLVPHESSKDCKVGGYHVPKGTMLMVNAWAIHNDPNTWKEPTKFKPERFEEIVDERNGFRLMPFGYGRRSCPGKHMAVRVITLALGSLIHCFEWERVSEEMVDLTEQTGIALFRDKPLMAICHPRSLMDNLLAQI